LVELIKAGYPHLKESIGLPPWLLPASSILHATETLGDEGILNLGRPLNLGTGFKVKSEPASGSLAMSPEDWPSAMTELSSREIAGPVIETLLEVTSRITGQMDRIRLTFDPRTITRSLAVLAFAPFVDMGKPLLSEASAILNVDAGGPSDILVTFAEAVLSEDVVAVEAVNDCISGHESWEEWADMLQQRAKSFKRSPRVIGVTPPLSPELASVLVTMLKEGETR